MHAFLRERNKGITISQYHASSMESSPPFFLLQGREKKSQTENTCTKQHQTKGMQDMCLNVLMKLISQKHLMILDIQQCKPDKY
jgi:hypothetical protein